MRRLTFKTPSGPLEYAVTHRSRVKKHLHMELDELGGLVVVAPKTWSQTHISATLTQNTTRVERFLAMARQRQLAPLQYAQGELHFYLGTRYPLVIHQVQGRHISVVLSGHEIHVYTRRLHEKDIQVKLQGWYRQQAMKIFSERLQAIARKAVWARDRDRSIPLKLRTMKRTWGNCSSSGVIKLNTHLIKAPLPVIDSVIAHELCHLEEMNHGKAFYQLLESLNPDWRQDRARLRSEGNTYLL